MIFSDLNNKNIQYKKIIIEYDNKITLRYPFKVYKKNPILKNVISKENFFDIIDKANIILCDAKMKKAKFDKVEINIFTYLIFLLSFIFTIIYIITFYYSPRAKDIQIRLKNCGIIFFSISLFVLFCTEMFFSLRKIKGDQNLLYFYRNEMINYLNSVNEIWKGKMIFSFDENTKNITCHLIIDENLKNLIISSKSSSNSKNSESQIDTSSIGTSKSNSQSISSNNKKSINNNNQIFNFKDNK
jgi:hypothetical protein